MIALKILNRDDIERILKAEFGKLPNNTPMFLTLFQHVVVKHGVLLVQSPPEYYRLLAAEQSLHIDNEL